MLHSAINWPALLGNAGDSRTPYHIYVMCRPTTSFEEIGAVLSELSAYWLPGVQSDQLSLLLAFRLSHC